MDDLQDWGQHAVTTFRDEVAATMQVLAAPAGEVSDVVEEWQDDLAQEYFGLPVAEIPVHHR